MNILWDQNKNEWTDNQEPRCPSGERGFWVNSGWIRASGRFAIRSAICRSISRDRVMSRGFSAGSMTSTNGRERLPIGRIRAGPGCWRRGEADGSSCRCISRLPARSEAIGLDRNTRAKAVLGAPGVNQLLVRLAAQ